MKCLLAIQKCSSCKGFTIHGLWGLEHSKHAPRLPKIHVNQHIQQQLERLWFSDPKYHHSNQWFWQHEYEKHGHDLFPNNPNMYFDITLWAFHFVKNNILPHFMQHLQDIQFAKNELRITLDYNKQTQQFTYKYTPTQNNRFDILKNNHFQPVKGNPPGFKTPRRVPPGFETPLDRALQDEFRSPSRYHQYTSIDF